MRPEYLVEVLRRSAKNLPGVAMDWATLPSELTSHYADELSRVLLEAADTVERLRDRVLTFNKEIALLRASRNIAQNQER